MKLNLYMVRQDAGLGVSGLLEGIDAYEYVPTQAIDGLTCELYVRRPRPKAPRWLSDLASIVDGDGLASLRNQVCSALLLVTRSDRRFILSYGGGHHTIDRECIEHGFGLRVVANVIAGRSGVMSAETRGLNQAARSQRTVLPAASALYELGIEPSDEWVRQLTGKPSIQDFANRVSGADSLKLSLQRFRLAGLSGKLDQIVERFLSDDYKRDFEFLDYFTRVGRDEKQLRTWLNGEVTKRIDARSSDIELASPEPLEPMDVHFYRLRLARKKGPELPELHRDVLYAHLDEWGDVVGPLNRVKVAAFGEDDLPVGGGTYNLSEYVISDVLLRDKRYVLSAGEWFVVDADYVAQVENRISKMSDITDQFNLPIWHVAAGDEAFYNRELSNLFGWRLLDKDNFPIPRPNQKVEICDLLTAQKQLICVKRLRRSPSLSHLFAQGVVSAQLLVEDEERYQPAVVNYLRELEPSADFGARDDWTIVYAIATERPGRLAEVMPFFSKVNLDRAARGLRAIGVNVALVKVPLAL
jgi:uncharacterized protein (TIGR04141 family)